MTPPDGGRSAAVSSSAAGAGNGPGGRAEDRRRKRARQMAAFLVDRVRDTGQELDEPVSVAELRRVLLPYPLCREQLELASKAEYDLSILELMADPGFLRAEDRELDDVVREERESPEPGLGCLDDFAASSFRLGPLVRQAAAGDGELGTRDASGSAADAESGPARAARGPADVRDGGDAPAAGGAGSADGAGDGGGDGDGRPVVLEGEDETAREIGDPGSCGSCGRDLPGRNGLRYCPYCGSEQTAVCRGCREPLDPGWTYCPACGREVRDG